MSDPFDPALDPLRSVRGLDGVAALGGLYVLTAVTVPVVPLVAGVGYLVEVLDAVARGDDHPGVFENVGRLARLTVGGTVISALYGGVPAVILAMTLYGASGLPGDAAQGTITGLAITLGSTASLFLAMAIAYALPAAWGLYAHSGRLRDALALGRLGPITRAPAYFVWTVTGWTVLIGGLAIGDALSVFVVGFFVAGYATVVTVGCWGRGLARTDAAPGG
ncbi:DUF4013 domain-containing protein [Halococcoides cellulosivorans]|uniref:DUF4013 domain-containing protein n=1 Tax=Halococcoides cellulosivorans TaxID=1679096 RepID=A0A2R4X1L5_9EURY|nr:DUF4013 domain-containing protein [Halococcoides cellulosivorans]AWB27680.1 hypothetical protein HARCEL1_08135 [Halococcoides cellulosivorans]